MDLTLMAGSLMDTLFGWTAAIPAGIWYLILFW